MLNAMYVHVPFCDHICAYCDFPRCGYHAPLVEKWLIALEQELHQVQPSACKSIYIGGGTPSCLHIKQLYRLLQLLSAYAGGVEEYTIEVNADSLDQEKIALCKQFGINRISMGAQSFQPALLQKMERKADLAMMKERIAWLRKAGITNISLDLIYGLPNQTLDLWKADLDIAVQLPITHLSLYALTIEEHSKFGREHIAPCDEDLEADYYELALRTLKEHGFDHYEISSFARDNHVSMHNLAYWHYEDFYGIGCGASGKENHVRYDNTRNLHTYLTQGTSRNELHLSKEEEMFEMMMMGLRLKEGVDEATFIERFDCSYHSVFEPAIQKHLQLGNLKECNAHLATTKQGMMLLHEVLVDFL